MPNDTGGEPLFAFREPEWLDEVDSTNNEIRRRLVADPDLPPGTVLATHLQTKGKGRMGRSWHSDVDAGLTFSFLWSGEIPLGQAATLPMACALAMRDVLESQGVDSRCKWPNDILVDGAKICGILAESLPGGPHGIRLIMGIGLNLADDPGRNRLVEQPVAFLSRFTGKTHDPAILLPSALRMFAARIRRWTEGGFLGIRDDMMASLWGVGREVNVRTGKNGQDIVKGRIDTLGDGGELILVGDDGRRFSVVSASALDV